MRQAPARAEPATLEIAAARSQAADALVRHKTVDYLRNLTARAAARAAGASDALFLDGDGNLAETTTANFFLIDGGTLVTPREGAILPGIVRAWTLCAAGRLGIEALEGDAAPETLDECEGAFVTNSIVGLQPVSRIGRMKLRDARESDVFKRLAATWADMTASAV